MARVSSGNCGGVGDDSTQRRPAGRVQSIPMKSENRRSLVWLAGVGVLVLLCLLFRRVFYVVELAALELRYLWWLVLIVVIGAWLASLVGRDR